MCNKPLYRLPIDCFKFDVIAPHFKKRVRNGALILSYEDYLFMRRVYKFRDEDFQRIPCGKCAGCRLDYAKRWAARCVLEAQDHKEVWFLTLTYNDEHLPVDDVENPITGEILSVNQLRRRDFQLFMKRLRKFISPVKVRVFYSGEYGSKTDRPHFHCILYGYDFADKQLFYCKKNNRKYPYHVPGGDDYFISQTLARIWGKGHCLIANVTPAACMYVAQYTSKKFSRPKTERERNRRAQMWYDITQETPRLVRRLEEVQGISPEFCGMSRRPALARHWFEQHENEVYSTDTIIYPNGAKLPRHLRYFDKLYCKHYNDIPPGLFWKRDRLSAFKEIRLLRAQALEKMRRSSLSEHDYLLACEESLQRKFERSRAQRDL